MKKKDMAMYLYGMIRLADIPGYLNAKLRTTFQTTGFEAIRLTYSDKKIPH
jgi:hypothetical protein